VVTQGAQPPLVLYQPFAGARLTSAGPQPFASSALDVQAQFGAALAARPLPPAQFTLFFVEGKDEFDAESRSLIDEVFGEIAKRPVADVLVIGTRTGSAAMLQRPVVAPAGRCRAQRLAGTRHRHRARRRQRPRQARAGHPHGRRRRRAAQPRVEVLVR